MNTHRKTHLTLLVVTLALLLHVATALGQNGSQYGLTGSVISVVGTQGGGQYSLTNAVGQIATETLSGDRYSVTHDFEPVITEPGDTSNKIYLPLVRR